MINKIKHKFRAKACETDGLKFGSKLERNYYLRLKEAKRAGALLFFLRQVPIDLPGGIKYRIDYVEFWVDGNVIFTECKGFDTPVGKIKIQQAQEILGIEINVIRK